MPGIVLLNPSKKKKKSAKKKPAKKKSATKKPAQKKPARKKPTKQAKGSTMAKKRGKKRAAPKKRRKRRNPSRGRRAASYARSTLGGINMMGAVKNTVPMFVGAITAKFFAKKFADGGAEGDNWTWKNYLLCLAGGFVSAFITQAIFRKRSWGQRCFEGAVLLCGYKLFTNDIATQNNTLEDWFGAADTPAFDPYSGVGDVGDIYETETDDFVKGTDGNWRRISEQNRLPAARMGDVMQANDPRYSGMGDIQVPAMSRYGAAATASQTARQMDADGM